MTALTYNQLAKNCSEIDTEKRYTLCDICETRAIYHLKAVDQKHLTTSRLFLH